MNPVKHRISFRLIVLFSLLSSLKADSVASLSSYSSTHNSIVPRSTNAATPEPTIQNLPDLDITASSSSSAIPDSSDLHSAKVATSEPALRSLLFLRGNVFNQALRQSATATQFTSRVGTTDDGAASGGAANGAVANGAANGGVNIVAATAGADAADGDSKGGRTVELRSRLDTALEGTSEVVMDDDEEGGEGGEEEKAEAEEGTSTPLADTPEKLASWFQSWRKNTSALIPPGFKDASTMEILELNDWPPVPMPLPNLGEDVRVDPSLDPNAWRPFHVKGTPRMITVFSAECSSYMDWQSVAMAYSFKRSGQPGKLVRLLACNEDALKGYRGLDIAPTMVVPNWNRGPRTGDWYPAINKPVGVKYWLDNSPDANEVEWVLIMDADQLIRRPVLPWELGAERGHPVSANYGYLKGCDNSFGELHMKNATYCDKVGGYIVMHIEDLRRLAPIWSSKSEEVRADVEHYTINATGDIHGQRWISEMYGYSFGSSDVGLKHIMIDSAMLYPGYDPPIGVDPRMIHYGLELKVLDWQWDKSGFYRQDMVNTCGQHFPDPPDISALPDNQTYEERRRDFIVIECMAVLNRALREFHRQKRGCFVEGERDVGLMDLGGASPTVTGELRADVWARERGKEVGIVREVRETSGSGKRIRVQGDYVVDVSEMTERAGLERGLLVVREPREGVRVRKAGGKGGAGEGEEKIPSDEDSVAYAGSATNEDEGGDGEAGDGGEGEEEEVDKPEAGDARELLEGRDGQGELGGKEGNRTRAVTPVGTLPGTPAVTLTRENKGMGDLQGSEVRVTSGEYPREGAAGVWAWLWEEKRWMYLVWLAGMVLLFMGVTYRARRQRRHARSINSNLPIVTASGGGVEDAGEGGLRKPKRRAGGLSKDVVV
ncbi:hypothetical protein CLOP_g5963 [Closterium sp. NIES-67]|nr:hypothetical protein CLOP_g5963 [Closterium sp. NIES-67]